jgi:dipeptidyl-peptidase 4
MKKALKFYTTLFLTTIITISSAFSTEEITLEKILRYGLFFPERIEGVRSMKDGKHYTVLDSYTQIIKYDYVTGNPADTLFTLQENNPDSIAYIEEYDLSDQEDKILLFTATESIYRYSFRALYYIYDIRTKEILPLFDSTKVQLASFAPDGKKVAFVYHNNLYYKDLEQDTIIQITQDGSPGEIINGLPDWVYEEEFTLIRAYDWSPDSRKIAYYRFDESQVKLYTIPFYNNLYPEQYQYKYPKAGEKNSLIEIFVYHLDNQHNIQMDIGTKTDIYIPRIKWTRDTNLLSITRLNRLQNEVNILLANAYTGSSYTIYAENNEKYLSEFTDNHINFIHDNKEFLIMSEKDGYMHIYRYKITGEMINQVTKGDWEIDEVLGINEKNDVLYYTSTEVSPLERHVYSIRLDGTGKLKLTQRKGVNEALFSANYQYFININSNANTPPFISLNTSTGIQLRVLKDNHVLQQVCQAHGFTPKDFFTFTGSSGTNFNGFMIKPPDFKPRKKYPVLIYVYGGPESQEVMDQWDFWYTWFQLLAQKGYVIACIDNRGTSGRGEAFEKSTYMQLGKLETIDQIDAARYLASLRFIDSERMGMFGWSYGGYMSLLCLFKGNGLLKMAVAVAPVTNWRYYDTIYTERFMRTPQENPDGYDDNSPINFVNDMKGKLLLIHGTADDNVHFQNTAVLTKKLVEADKQFDMQIYPDKNHGIGGGNTTYHLFKRITDYITTNL